MKCKKIRFSQQYTDVEETELRGGGEVMKSNVVLEYNDTMGGMDRSEWAYVNVSNPQIARKKVLFAGNFYVEFFYSLR